MSDNETLFTRDDISSQNQVDAIVYIAENGLPDKSKINSDFHPAKKPMNPEEIPDIFSTELDEELKTHYPWEK